MWKSIDHSILSPSGLVSKAARKRALERASKELFPNGLDFPDCKQATEKETLLRHAKEWRELAARGMKPRKHTKLAEEAEAKAAMLNR